MFQHGSLIAASSGDCDVLVLSPLAKAVAKALSEPFAIGEGTGRPLVAQLNHEDGVALPVYANGNASEGALATARSLHDVCAPDAHDRTSMHDLVWRSEECLEPTVHHIPGVGVSASQWYRFVLYHLDVPIGFCSAGLRIDQIFEQRIPEIHLELGPAFIAPEMRAPTLVRMFAKAVGKVTVAMLTEFRIRCEKHGVAEECSMSLIVHGEATSDGEKKFGKTVFDELEVQLSAANLLFGTTDDFVRVGDMDGSVFF